MRIARVQTGEKIRTAVVSPNGQTARVLGPETSVLDALASHNTEQLTAGSAEHPIEDVQLLAPIDPPAIRDFSVFEQHIEGIVQRHRSRRAGTRKLVPVAVLLLLKPRAR